MSKKQVIEENIINKKNDYDNNKKKSKKKKKFKIKINWTKVCVWFALLAMIGSAITAILSPIFSR